MHLKSVALVASRFVLFW